MATDVTQDQDVIKRARDEIEKRSGKTPEQLYEEREKRVSDTMQLKIPDRVPVLFRSGYFPVRYAGLSASAKFYDPVAHRKALVKTFLDFESDLFIQSPAGGNVSGLALEILSPVETKWPGGPLSSDDSVQFVGTEMMKENEYDLFITDPSDFIVRYYLPRAWKAMAPLSKLPPLRSLAGGTGLASQSTRFSPEIIQAFEAIHKAGQEQAKFSQLEKEIGVAVGVPPLVEPGGVGGAPFDMFGDSLRGMRGMMVDMFERPEKMHIAMERMLEWQLARAVPASAKERGKRRVGGGANHWGGEEFLSKKQFETFCWPTWKRALLASIDLGFVPGPFMEGRNDSRVEYFLELPKGKAFVRFETIDIFRAKNILGGHLCILGGVPGALLWSGSPQEVDEYCKNIIKVCGKGGGFILFCSNGDDAKPANLKAMVDSVKKYGRND